MKRRGWIWPVLSVILFALTGCRGYQAPQLDTTGFPASPLGQVLDLDVSLPLMPMAGARWPGLELEVRIEIEKSGFGKLPARVFYGPAHFDMRTVEVEDLSDGKTSILITPDTWFGMLGPIRIEDTLFDLILNGTTPDGGWNVSGVAHETRTGTQGVFTAWRRHRFLVAGSDFFSDIGRVAIVELVRDSEIRTRQALEFVSSDTTLRVRDGTAFAVNRFTFDNLQRLDPSSDFLTSWQVGVGEGANPHDIFWYAEDKAYVSRYEPPYNDLALIDPRNGKMLGSISLELFAENPDGTPRADRFGFAEGTLFVGLQDIDRTFTDFAEGKLAVIDPLLDEPVGVIPLGGKNPGTIEELRGGDGRMRLYVALAGIFPGLQSQELSGGVVVVDVMNRAVERWALDDDDAGGNIVALALASERLGYVVVSDESFTNRVLAFDPEEATVLRTVLEQDDLIPEIEVDTRGLLAVPDRSFFEPRLCLYRIPADPQAIETLIGCGPLELPPFSVEALD